MEIVITENQYNRLLLKEEDLSIYKDNNLDMEVQGFDKNTGTVVLKPNENQQIEIMVRGWVNKPILFNFIKVSPFITDLKTKNTGKKSEIIRPNGFLDYTFTIPKTKIGTFTVGFTFVYEVVGSSTPITKSINIPFYRSYNGVNNKCKTISENSLGPAVTWWKNWLNNQATKNRFAKSFNYDNKTVEKHFKKYNEILDEILNKVKLDYTNDPSSNSAAWVAGGNTIKFGIVPNITVNCSKSGAGITLLIHEIQHVLTLYHKFGDYTENILDYGIDHILSDNTHEVDDEKLKTFLKSQGFTENIDEIIKIYKFYIKRSEMHIRNQNEVVSNLFELRKYLNLKPEQKITKEMLTKYTNKLLFHEPVAVFISAWLYSEKTFDDYLNSMNSIAMQKTNTTDRNLA
jgi:hypothetical protein